MIQLITKKYGRIVMNRTAGYGTTAEEVDWIASCEVNDGYADYAVVLVDGEIYSEYEA